MNERPTANLVIGDVDGGQLLANLNHFARLLRSVGFCAALDTTQAAARALTAVGFVSRRDVFWTLAAVFVDDARQLPIFRQAFRLFWRSAKETPLPAGEGGAPAAPTLQRLADALAHRQRQRAEIQLQWDAEGTASADAAFRNKDFEQMSEEEWRAAVACVRTLSPTLSPLPMRRRRTATTGLCDIKKSARAAFPLGGELVHIKRSKRRTRLPDVVILADISASMSTYARLLAHFIAALNARASCHVAAFLFGTELTPIRRRKSRDLDAAVASIAAATNDWEGGTRIGASLAAFNRQWSRRVLSSGAVVLLATDGLECGDLTVLEKEAERLKKSCRRLLWLNPLLRYDAYQALAGGARILARHADETRSIHNIKSMTELTRCLSSPRDRMPRPCN